MQVATFTESGNTHHTGTVLHYQDDNSYRNAKQSDDEHKAVLAQINRVYVKDDARLVVTLDRRYSDSAADTIAKTLNLTVLVGAPTAEVAPVDLGRYSFTIRACSVCHSIDGSRASGPTLKGVFGKPVMLDSGAIVVADEAYLRESIVQPNAKVVSGFLAIQPPYDLSDVEIAGLVAYMESLH